MKKNEILSTISIAAVMGIILISVPSILAQEDDTIPAWVKTIAGAWANDDLDDDSFLRAMEFLIMNEIINIPGYGMIDVPNENMTLSIVTDKEAYVGDEPIIVSMTLPNEYFGDIVLTTRDESGGYYGQKIIYANGTAAEGIIELGLDVLLLNNGTYVIQGRYQDETVETTFGFTAKELTGQLTVETDKNSYIEYETMSISGTVPDYRLISSVSLTLIVPNGGLSTIGSVQLDENYNYSKDIELNSTSMEGQGNFTLRASYYGETVETIFEYIIPRADEPVEVPEIHEITVITDKDSYVSGEVITINGTVTSTIDDVTSKRITVVIMRPDMGIVDIAQIDVDENGLFTHLRASGGALWDQTGTYTVRVAYDYEIVETTFEFT